MLRASHAELPPMCCANSEILIAARTMKHSGEGRPQKLARQHARALFRVHRQYTMKEPRFRNKAGNIIISSPHIEVDNDMSFIRIAMFGWPSIMQSL